MKSLHFFWILCCGTALLSLNACYEKSVESSSMKEGIQLNQEQDIQSIHDLIASYTQARQNRDSTLLKSILTTDIDQLVSSGTWRYGIEEAQKGMMRSSSQNPGKRSITVERVRFLTKESAIADARYQIENEDGSVRKMWSTFVVVSQEEKWKIAAIRNMLPAVRP